MVKITWGVYEPPADSGPFGEWKLLSPSESEQLRRTLQRTSVVAAPLEAQHPIEAPPNEAAEP
jgi:hypothetical protein